MLIVLAKEPRPGFVKTRMSPALSARDAADLYRAMLLDVLEESARTCELLGLEGVLSVTPPEACGELAKIAPPSFRVVSQRGGGLGERMEHEVVRAFASGARRVVLRGSDNPVLATPEISTILDLLEQAEVAISPDLDGGYGAIGLGRTVPGIFDHAMSTRSVLIETVENAKAAGCRVELGPSSFDLDTIEDLQRLVKAREPLPKGLCLRTLEFLDKAKLC